MSKKLIEKDLQPDGVTVEAVLTASDTIEPDKTVIATAAPDCTLSVGRVRKTETGLECPRCKGNAVFVVSTRGYPAFIAARLRRHKCRECGYAFKNLK